MHRLVFKGERKRRSALPWWKYKLTCCYYIYIYKDKIKLTNWLEINAEETNVYICEGNGKFNKFVEGDTTFNKMSTSNNMRGV